MEHIQLQTPWRRGDGKRCQEPGWYLCRSIERPDCICLIFKEKEAVFTVVDYYCGPLEISAPEPMPELVRVEGCDGKLAVEKVDSGYRALTIRPHDTYSTIAICHPDERTAREAFNAAAKVLNGQGDK